MPNTDAQSIAERFLDEGKLIEAGFAAFRLVIIPTDAPPGQVRALRNAYFAGAQHLFGTIMNALDPGSEPTERDEHRMELILKELDSFVVELRKKPHEHDA